MSGEELEYITSAAAERLNSYKHKERVKIIIPLRGFSSLSVKNGPLYDPESDKMFAITLKKCLDPEIEIIEVDSDINSKEFAAAVAETLLQALGVR
jgi:uncharacterized protein (UPF0261 family)